MYDLMLELFVFFGIDKAPANFAELIPWLITVFLSIAIVFYVFNLLFSFMRSFNQIWRDK